MIPIAEPYFAGNEKKYVNEALESGWVSSIGEFITRFEKAFAGYCGTKHATSCCNGTVALHLALKAFGIGNGDEVIVPNFTFVATASTVKFCNARPVFVDIRPDTWNIDPALIGKKITPKTKAIIPVHIYGCPADMQPIMEIAEKHGLLVIEDAAEAHGAEYRGKKVGSLGHASTFSFYGNKNITTGEGGMVLSNDSEFMEQAELLKNHGMRPEKRLWHEVVGFNYRMTNLQAALGLAQLEGIDEIIRRKRNNAMLYSKMLSEIGGLTLPAEPKGTKNVFWLYSPLVEKGFGIRRDALIESLKQKGIDSRRVFYPLSTMPPYKTSRAFPVSLAVAEKGISLPSSAGLTEEQIEYITKAVKETKKKLIYA